MKIVRSLPGQIIIAIFIFLSGTVFIRCINYKSGYVTPQTWPLCAEFKPEYHLWIIPPIIVFIIFLIVFRTILRRADSLESWKIILISIGFKIFIDTFVAMSDGGFKALCPTISGRGLYDSFYADVPKVKNLAVFLRDYTKILPTLRWHSHTHPPGGAIFQWAVARIFGHGMLQASIAIIVFTSQTIIPIFLLAQQLYGRKIAIISCAFFILAPNVIMYTATCMDGVFAVFPIWSVYLFYKGLCGKTILYSILTGFSLAIAMILNYTTVCIGVFFIAAAALYFLFDRQNFSIVFRSLLISATVFFLFYLILYAYPGYNILSCLKASIKEDENSWGTGYGDVAQYFFRSITNLAAFLLCVGIPSAVLWLREVIKNLTKKGRKNPDIYVLAYFIGLIFIAFSTLFTLETERIWLFMVPFIAIPAAKQLVSLQRKTVYGVLCFLFFQTMIFEVFMWTYAW